MRSVGREPGSSHISTPGLLPRDFFTRLAGDLFSTLLSLSFCAHGLRCTNLKRPEFGAGHEFPNRPDHDLPVAVVRAPRLVERCANAAKAPEPGCLPQAGRILDDGE